VAESAHTRLQLSDVKGMMGFGVNDQSDRRAVRPCMLHHVSAAFRRGPIIRLSDQHQSRRRHRGRGDAAIGIIGDRRAKALVEILCGQAALDGVERREAAHRLTEHGDPRRIDER